MSHVIVLGMGIAGSAAAMALAEAGHRVTAIEQYDPLHERGSSHGDTRIYRRVPHEGAQYFPLATVSWDGWQRWGRQAGEDLLVVCGGMQAGPAGAESVARCETLCREHGQPFEMMDGAEVNRRFPLYDLPSDWEVAYQPNSGYCRPDATRVFLHQRARELGATLLFDTAVLGIERSAAGVSVRTASGPIVGDKLIVAAGSWLSGLLPELAMGLQPERRVIAWFAPEKPVSIGDGRMPIFIFAADGGWYGMPTPDGSLKLGHNDHLRQVVTPGAAIIQPDAVDAAFLGRCVRSYFKGVSPEPTQMRACIYTLSPDHHFTIDRHPEDARIGIIAACSGHGFKYAPAYGAAAVALAGEDGIAEYAAFARDRAVGPAFRHGELV